MKKTKTLRISIICMMFIFVGSSLFAQLQTDSKYGFEIDIPSDWSKNSYMDGTDKIYDYMSQDENSAVQLRVFDAGGGITTAVLAQVYEESYLPEGSQKLSLNDFKTINGIPCKKGVYLLNFNGVDVGMSAYYVVENNNGYVLTALIASSMIEQKGPELKAIVESFKIDGFSAASKNTKKPGGLGGLMGSASSASTNNAFKIVDISLSDQLDTNNNAINPKNTFNTQTAEINAAITFTGTANADLIVSWIFKDWDRTITSDAYVFSGNGGIGVVSLSKPNNGWPEGNYLIKFEMDGKLIKELTFTVSDNSSSGTLAAGSTTSSTNGAKKAVLTHNGFDFATGNAKHVDGETIGWNSGNQTNPNYSSGVWWRGNNSNAQADLGNISLASVVELPSSGWDQVINPLILGHVYVVKCKVGYAAFKVLKQPDPNSNLWETEVEYIYSASGNFK